MTDKEKLEKIKQLADTMYNKMQNLTIDASGIRKAMEDYHQFIIYQYYKEEPVNNDLEEAANDYAHDLLHDDVFETFIAGAKWQKGKTLSDVKKAVTGKMFQFTMNNVEARGDDPNGKTVTLEGPVTFHINNPESIIDALIMELENNN